MAQVTKPILKDETMRKTESGVVKTAADLLAEIRDKISGSGGTTDYTALTNKPKINSVELLGNKSLSDLGLAPKSYIDEHDEGLQTNITNEATARNNADIALGEDIDKKIDLLGNEAGSGEPYNIPYHIADLKFEDSKIKGTLHTITIDNHKTLKTFPLEVALPFNTKQDTLVSGTNIKTINGNSVLGSGDIVVSGEPSAYLKSADVSTVNTLKLKNKDDSDTDFTVDFREYRTSDAQDLIDAGKQAKLPEYVDGKYLKCVDDGTGVSLSWEDVASGEPDEYIKSASVSDNTLTLNKKDGSAVTYTPDLSNYVDMSSNQSIGGDKTFTSPLACQSYIATNGEAGFVVRYIGSIDNYRTNGITKVRGSNTYNILTPNASGTLALKENVVELLGNEAGSGGPYHFPYHIGNLRFDSTDNKIKAQLFTVTLDNNKTLTQYPLEVQLPFDDKQDKITDTSKLSADLISDGTTNKVLTDTLKTQYDNYATNKLDSTKSTYTTTAPTEAITDGGIHIVHLASSTGVTEYNGYIYMYDED